MARPKANLGELSARNRIKEAFWNILADEGYSSVTIKRIAAEAGVNHKTIYYHFHSIDEMAQTVFDEVVASANLEGLIDSMLHGVDESSFFDDPQANKALQRVCLYARGDSAYLVGIFRERIVDAWATQTGVDLTNLHEQEQAFIGFTMRGLTWLVGEAVRSGRSNELPILMVDPVWRGIRETILDIAVRNAQEPGKPKLSLR